MLAQSGEREGGWMLPLLWEEAAGPWLNFPALPEGAAWTDMWHRSLCTEAPEQRTRFYFLFPAGDEESVRSSKTF